MSATARLSGILVLVPVVLAAQQPLPLKLAPRPTKAEISVADLMTRVYRFADDSMNGRLTGSNEFMKGTEYIAAELKRLGLQPAGTDGFFQDVPLGNQVLDSASTIGVGGRVLNAGIDFAGTAPLGLSSGPITLPLIYAGRNGDTAVTLTPDDVRGKAILLMPAAGPMTAELYNSAKFQQYLAMVRSARITVVVVGPRIPPGTMNQSFRVPNTPQLIPDSASGPITIFIPDDRADVLFGSPVSAAQLGAVGNPVAFDVRFKLLRRPGRNVVAVLPGRDPALRGQYVAIGAHSDHVGYRTNLVDSDSMRAFNSVVRPQGADSPPRAATPEEQARIKSAIDSARALHGGPRPDSIMNGADDDASGSMGLLEIAERLSTAREKPRRSTLFVWHVGEELGMFGSEYFTDHPTVPRDSIVAQLNIDMIGRGGSSDVTGSAADGQPVFGSDAGYLQLIGSRRLSTELGDLVEQVNTSRKAGFKFDYTLDANGHPQNIYCRSDHWSYARYGIPVVFFTTGGHRDYHQVSDEPQYLSYEHYRRVTQFIHDVAVTVGNRDRRPVVDKPKPDPRGACRQ